MPDIKFSVEDVDYVAHLSKGYVTMNGRDRKTCSCTISMNNPIRVFSGIAIKNPNDDMKYDENCGYHLAFKRAIFQYFLVCNIVKDVAISKEKMKRSVVKEWIPFWHKLRVPFGKALHEWYDEDFPF